MGKIGRNDPCPCGSGEKFKRCCIRKKTAQPTANSRAEANSLKLSAQVEKTQRDAVARVATLRNLGVFIFFTTESGDGWLLELSDMDALKVAEAGVAIPVEIMESKETIEVNWSHQFWIKNGMFTTKTYTDNSIETYANYPNPRIRVAVEHCLKRFPKALLDKVHIRD